MYARTSRNTGVSFGPIGLIFYAWGWLIMATLVVMAVAAVIAFGLAVIAVATLVGATEALIHNSRRLVTRRVGVIFRSLEGAATNHSTSRSGRTGQPPEGQARYSSRR